jgi:hypothetical protein
MEKIRCSHNMTMTACNVVQNIQPDIKDRQDNHCLCYRSLGDHRPDHSVQGNCYDSRFHIVLTSLTHSFVIFVIRLPNSSDNTEKEEEEGQYRTRSPPVVKCRVG